MSIKLKPETKLQRSKISIYITYLSPFTFQLVMNGGGGGGGGGDGGGGGGDGGDGGGGGGGGGGGAGEVLQ